MLILALPADFPAKPKPTIRLRPRTTWLWIRTLGVRNKPQRDVRTQTCQPLDMFAWDMVRGQLGLTLTCRLAIKPYSTARSSNCDSGSKEFVQQRSTWLLMNRKRGTISLIHLQGLQVIHHLAMNHRIVLIRSQLCP